MFFVDEYCRSILSRGATGHTVGAAGGIEVALATEALAAQTVPPTVGFQNPEEGAQGRVSSKPVPFEGDYILTSNSGFGGINAAIILEKKSIEHRCSGCNSA